MGRVLGVRGTRAGVCVRGILRALSSCSLAQPFVLPTPHVVRACVPPLVPQAFMHGFWLEMKLYNKVLAVADPFAFERYRKERCVGGAWASALPAQCTGGGGG